MGHRLAVVLAVCLCLPALAYAAAGDPKERLTPADQAKAKAMLLVRSDLATGWIKTSTPDSGDDITCAGFDPDLSDLTLTGKGRSQFTNRAAGANVFSYVSLYATPAQARSAWSRVIKPALARCLAHVIERGVAGQGVDVAFTKQGRVAFPAVAPRTAAFRIVAVISAPQSTVKVPVAVDLVVLGRGRSEVVLAAMAAGKGIPAADVRAFARLLAGRMLKAGA